MSQIYLAMASFSHLYLERSSPPWEQININLCVSLAPYYILFTFITLIHPEFMLLWGKEEL